MFVFTAGYRMMSVVNPELCRKVTLRHCVSLVAPGLLSQRCYQCVTSQHGGSRWIHFRQISGLPGWHGNSINNRIISRRKNHFALVCFICQS